MNSKQLHELIDACRPGHEDVELPEFGDLAHERARDPQVRQLYERSQELDTAIQASFHAVTPPPGLADRILDAIETSSCDPVENSPTVEVAEPIAQPAKAATGRSLAIRTGVVALLSIAAAVAILLAIPERSFAPSEGESAELVARWNSELKDDNWQTTASFPSEEYPLWQDFELGSKDHWQLVPDRKIACYDFDTSQLRIVAKVRLFVMIPDAQVELPTTPPAGYSAGGWHVGAWHEKGRVYFLAVQAGRNSKRLYSEISGSSRPTA